MVGSDQAPIGQSKSNGKSSSTNEKKLVDSTENLSPNRNSASPTINCVTPLELIRLAYKENGVYSGTKPKRVPLGVDILESLIGGLSPGNLCVLGALPNVGKSTTLIDWAFRIMDLGFVAGIISVEDSPQLFGERIQAYYSAVSATDIRSNGHSYGGTGLAERVEQEAATSRLRLTFPPNRYFDEVLEAMDALVAEGADVIYIDYFSAIENPELRNPRAGYNHMLITMKARAAQLGVPLVLAAQIARMPSKFHPKTNKVVEVEPDYNNLGETSFLERMSEVVILLWKNHDGDTFGRLAKNKYGRARLPKFNVWQEAKTGRLQYKEVTGNTLEPEIGGDDA